MINVPENLGVDTNSTIRVSPIGSIGPRINSSSAAGARQTLWNQFQNTTVPTLREMEHQLKTRQGRFVEEATDSANKAQYMAENQARINREALGIELTPEQAKAQKRLDILGGASSSVAAQNEAVDIAREVNTSQANSLLNIQTGITTEALGDLQGADSLKDAREGNDAGRKAQARSQNMATAGTILTIAAMMV